MSASVVPFFRPARRSQDWSAQELAEFYRVEAALMRAGLQVEVDRGMTDEGDPWFVFCRASDGETVIHFARIDGMYIVAASVYGGVARGRNFNALVRDLIERHPTIAPRSEGRSNLIFHPAALLVILVATAIFKTAEARAFTPGQDTAPDSSARHTTYGSGTFVILSDADTVVSIDAQHARTILSAVVIALASDPPLQASVLSHTSSVESAGIDDHLLSLPSDVLDPHTAIHDAVVPSTNQLEGSGALSLVAILWGLPIAQVQNHLVSDVTYSLEPPGLDSGLPSHSSMGSFSPPTSDPPVINLPAPATATLVIELASSAKALPDVIAAHVLFESGIAIALGQGAVLQLATLPDTIASILQTSLHVAGDSPGISLDQLINEAVHVDTSIAFNSALTVEVQNHANIDLSAVTQGHTTADASAGIPGQSTADMSAGGQSQTNVLVTPESPSGVASPPATQPPTLTSNSGDHQDSPPPDAIFHSIETILTSSAAGAVPTISSPTDMANLTAVDTAVKVFASEVGLDHLSGYAVLDSMSNNSVALIDQDAVQHHLGQVVSITFDFKDGTSISLIGLPGEILHAIGWSG
jgi:hypothetical protein